VGNFSRSQNKTRYAYLLTAEGLEQKARATYHFLRRKMQEYEELRAEIEELKAEVHHELGSEKCGKYSE